jgi:hypothetical protein
MVLNQLIKGGPIILVRKLRNSDNITLKQGGKTQLYSSINGDWVRIAPANTVFANVCTGCNNKELPSIPEQLSIKIYKVGLITYGFHSGVLKRGAVIIVGTNATVTGLFNGIGQNNF